MTNEEAIKILKIELEPVDPLFSEVQVALDMAIKALQDRPQSEWIDKGTYAVCSNCGADSGTQFDGVQPVPRKTSFCPDCGTRMKGAEMISPKEFAEKMGQIAEERDDTEVCHIKMDDYICEVLRTLGYKEGVEIFENTPKWYS